MLIPQLAEELSAQQGDLLTHGSWLLACGQHDVLSELRQFGQCFIVPVFLLDEFEICRRDAFGFPQEEGALLVKQFT